MHGDVTYRVDDALMERARALYRVHDRERDAAVRRRSLIASQCGPALCAEARSAGARLVGFSTWLFHADLPPLPARSCFAAPRPD